MTGLAPPPPGVVSADVARALAEDVGDGDRTAALVDEAALLETRVVSRQHATLAGRAWFDEVFHQVDAGVRVRWLVDDGAEVVPDQEVCRLAGPARGILTGERTALNFLQTLSGTATRTRRYVDAVAGTGARILDTRKTLPGLRHAQKYATRCGGAVNHRLGLYDAILVKENHIEAAGSITAAVEAARRHDPELPLEVEVENLEQLAEARAAGVPRVLLDNFDEAMLRAAVRAHHGAIELEASGGITLETARAVAETGVDYLSTGDITKSVDAVDFSMRFV